MNASSTSQLLSLTLIFLGGGVGSVARYLIAGLDHHLNRHAFPFGTLTVNLVGCLAIGCAGAWFVAERSGDASRELWRLALAVGLLGGFTTFSTFGLETARLLGDGRHGLAGAYVLASNLGGIGLAWAGYVLVGHALAARAINT